ncbi:hypothetical protein [Salinivibrio costicola]|uniref:hypothetical protein n=1 Tax=Salinivibrio costicola TaxID=51367 RepID=UPI003F7196B1
MLKTVVIILLVLLGITAAQYLEESTQKKLLGSLGPLHACWHWASSLWSLSVSQGRNHHRLYWPNADTLS